MELKSKLEHLELISGALDPGESQRNELLNKCADFANDFLKNIDHDRSYLNEHVTKDLSIQKENKSIDELLELYRTEVIPKGIRTASGGHLGYIPGGGLYVSALADYLADISNEYAGMYFGSPGAVTIENEVLDWIKSVFNYPSNAVGNLASGGSISTLTALTAARDKHQIKGAKIEKSAIYTSAQVHHCINKAIRIIGLEDIKFREIELDDHHRIDVKKLQEAIDRDLADGINPFMVIASAGTTDTGAIDPLNDIADICEQHNMWYHVDGAYGGFFILVDELKDRFKGIERSDSLVVDPHKGLFLPYGVGAVLVKDKQAVMHSQHYLANYMQDTFDDSAPINPADVSPELTKHFRGLRVWLPLQLHGVEPFKACLEEKILLTQYFRKSLINLGFKVGPSPDLSVSYFWYPQEIDQNKFNQRLMQLIHEDGDIFLSSTTINDNFVIRMAILSFRTKTFTIDKTVAMVQRCLAKVKSEMI